MKAVPSDGAGVVRPVAAPRKRVVPAGRVPGMPASSTRRRDRRKAGIVLAALALFALPVACAQAAPAEGQGAQAGANGAAATSVPQWSGKQAMRDIEKLLSFGPRAIGAFGHERAIGYIRDEMSKASTKVDLQRWTHKTKDGATLALTNIVARLDPANPRRILVGTHYDSIVRAYRDREHPDGIMPGANNGASGVALLLESARTLARTRNPLGVGVDFVFFDGEEGPRSLGEGDPEWFPLGSPYLAARLEVLGPRRPEKAVIFDMVCYSGMKLRPEQSSLRSAPSEVERFWSIGRRIAPDIFVDNPTAAIFDDQIAFANLGIPSLLVIGFEYEPWFNTTKDTLERCSAKSLEAVGRTLVEFLRAS